MQNIRTKIKRFIAVCLSVALICGMLCAQPVMAYLVKRGPCGDNLTWTLDNNGTLTINGTGRMYYYPSICAILRDRTSSVKNVVVLNGVTSIGERAFYGCSNLRSITIPDSVTSIGREAFYGTAYYNDPDNWTGNVLYINNHLIDAETSLSGTYSICSGTKTIADGAFCGCNSLRSVAIPDSVTSIGGGAFYGCESLTNVTFPDGVTGIEWYAFYDCESLTNVTIPDSVTSIGIRAFYGTAYYNNPANWIDNVLYINNHLIDAKTSLSGTYGIRSGTKTIADEAFYNCGSLRSITIPDSMTSIGNYAFFRCGSLTSVTVPNSVMSIGYGAFIECYTLESITIPNSVTSIGGAAFAECHNLCIYGCSGSYAQEYANNTKVPFMVGTKIGDKVFTDVKPGAWYVDAVQYALANSVFNGMSETTFEPNTEMTRAMLVKVLYNLEGNPLSTEYTNPFSDVKEGQWYTEAVKWAASTGVVYGTTGTTFSPNDKITREQLSTILYRYSQKKGYNVTVTAELASFPDGDKISGYAEDAIKWAVGVGLISGNKIGGVNMVDARGNATRAQVAMILMNFSTIEM